MSWLVIVILFIIRLNLVEVFLAFVTIFLVSCIIY